MLKSAFWKGNEVYGSAIELGLRECVRVCEPGLWASQTLQPVSSGPSRCSPLLLPVALAPSRCTSACILLPNLNLRKVRLWKENNVGPADLIFVAVFADAMPSFVNLDPIFKRRITSIHPEALYKSIRSTAMLRESQKFTPKVHDWLNGTKVAELMRDWQGYHRYGTFYSIYALFSVWKQTVRRKRWNNVLNSQTLNCSF